MRAAAIAVSVAWFLVAFVVRIAIQWRATGDTGFRSQAGRPWSPAAVARVALVLAIGLAAAGPIVAGSVDADGDASATLRWTGLALAVVGIAATFVAQLRMGASWRIGVDPTERTDLVTGGMFAVVRNPIFTTMAATAVGLTLIAPTPVGVAGLALLVVALELQVRAVEEPYLRATHGRAYRDYEGRVGRFVPAVGRRR
jgi:protein-S-isoprenylcysteine O-methyltransferase Ste14